MKQVLSWCEQMVDRFNWIPFALVCVFALIGSASHVYSQTSDPSVQAEVSPQSEDIFAASVQASSTASAQAAAVLGFLAFGTFWFWVSVVAIIIILFACIENETGLGATVALVIYAVLLQWVSNVDIIGFVLANPTRTIAVAVAYVGIGIFWSAFRFWWFMGTKVQKIKDGEGRWTIDKLTQLNEASGMNYNQARTSATVEYNDSGMPQTFYDDWNKYVDDNSPRALQNKGFIMRSMGYWPISMLWFVLSDFVTELFSKIYHRLSKVYENIAQSVINTAKKK
jgi:hypothetical protein